VNAVWVSLRADARRRWRAWLGVALIVGLFGGIVTATAAGARRTDNAYSRLVAANHGAPYMIEDFIPNPEAASLEPAAVAALPAIAEADSVDENFLTQPPTTPADLVNFGRIQNLPLILGGVLAVLALITVAHLLATSIRRRRRDLAILKTLGFTRGDVGRAVAWQATTLAAVTLMAGIPLGVVAGRGAWRLFAGQLGVVPAVATPVVLLVLVIPGAILLAILISIGPAVTAMRTRPASVLREE
jgi:predicted lysophospholipase L1 biosynthesis ABC-type transport system permease subunit